MLSIPDELKIIEQSSSEEERQSRVQQLQARLREEDMRRKLRNVKLISSVERLGERAGALRQLTDRLTLIKRQYEVLSTHLSEEAPVDQSQHGDAVTPLRASQSGMPVAETVFRQSRVNLGMATGGGDVAEAATAVLAGYQDPRLSAADGGWQPDRDSLGRSVQGRAALLRARMATALPGRPPPLPQPHAGAADWTTGRSAPPSRPASTGPVCDDGTWQPDEGKWHPLHPPMVRMPLWVFALGS
ncbi:uncharacterized protein LOC119099874 [Pollicipes pollicipes]|uniref:uncharacterized protein LOC119099874 n=1 Tax=Pollicipes pollicipes TaxID=41117 RepID=UPI001885630C|nr:uncharacterized protein LOC119099874 [Pollicipes pollicipes]